jgi:peptidoglycan/xylan/chitin deacetylase (PgdA/CDA1 family)
MMSKGRVKFIISCIYFFLCKAYGALLHVFHKKTPGTFVVLFYHEIAAAHRRSFARQMDMLIKNAVPVRSDFNGPLESGTHYVAVTFDDAFTSVLENAMPELIQRNIPCTVFTPTACLGKQPDWIKGCHEMIVTEQQLKDVAENQLIAIGSHTHTHPRLADLKQADAFDEIRISKQILENTLKRDIAQLAFPFGSYNDACIALAYQAGYKRVFGILPTIKKFQSDDFFVGRAECEPDCLLMDFFLRIAGAYQWMAIAVLMKRYLLTILKLRK